MKRAVLAAGLLAGLTACSYTYSVAFTVHVDPAVVAGGGNVVMQITGQARDNKTLPLVPGQTEYAATLGTCCAPDPSVALSAFIDVDKDGLRGASEPGADDPRGTFVLSKDTQTTLRIKPPAATAAP